MVWAISIETRVDIGVAMLLTVKSPFGLRVGWIVIVPPEADALLAAFALWMRAAVDGIDPGAEFCINLTRPPRLVPDTAIGRMLDQDEAPKLIRRLESRIPK